MANYYQHCYNVFMVNGDVSMQARIWAHNRDEVRSIVYRRYPGMRIECIEYIK